MKHLILSLSHSGTGEAQVGFDIGQALVERGHEVSVVCDPAVFHVFKGSDMAVYDVPPEGWGRIEPVLVEAAKGRTPNTPLDSLLLADFAMAAKALDRRGVASDFLARLRNTFGGRLVVIDTWHSPEIEELDAAPDDHFGLSPDLQHYPFRMAPVPFVRPSAPHAFRILPDAAEPAPRASFGLPDAPIVFLATSIWQHRRYVDPVVEAARVSVLPLLGAHLEALPESVHVVQLGPQPLRVGEPLKGRYHWVPNLPPAQFRPLVASVDCVLSLNAAAMTNALAVASGVPVVTLMNPSPYTHEQVSVYPFLMWPYSMWNALSPVLADNPYGALMNLTDIHDGEAVQARLRSLLDASDVRAAEARRRADYLAGVAALPTGAELLLDHLEAP
jgi:hypothetical protein